MRIIIIAVLVCSSLTLLCEHSAKAGVSQEVVEQAVVQLQKLFAREVAEVGVESFSRQVAKYAAEHGDDGLRALRSVGPKAIRLSADAGEHAALATRLMARHGAKGADLVANSRCLRLCSQYGDEMAESALRHPGISLDVVEKCGQHAVTALNRVGSQNARRMAMLIDEPAFRSDISRRQLMETIARYGDKACDFVWRNKVALATTSAATVFFLNPEPFLSGAEKLSRRVASQVSSSILEAFWRTAWTYPTLSLLALMLSALYFRVPLTIGTRIVANCLDKTRRSEFPSHHRCERDMPD